MSRMNEGTHRGDGARPTRRSEGRLTDVEVSATERLVTEPAPRGDGLGVDTPLHADTAFEELLAHVPLSVMVLDAELRLVYVNGAASERLDQAPDDVLGRGAEEIVTRLWPEAQGEEFLSALRRTLASGDAIHIPERPEYRIAHRRHEYSEWMIERITLRDGQPGVACYARDVTEQVHAREQIRREESDARRLQELSAELVQQDDVQALYERIVEGAAVLMRSQFASMQILHPERGVGGELQLLAHRGFDAQAADHWRWVPIGGGTPCGEALRTGQRVIVADVEDCEFMAGTSDLAESRRLGIRAIQTTPLVARSGRMLGMISTHWDRPHQPSARDLANLDLIARQAADLIERRQAADALRESRDVLSLVMRGGRIGAWSRKPGANAVWWSRELEEIFGLPPGGFPGTQEAFVELVHPDDRASLAQAVGEATEGGGDYAVEFRFRHSSGEWRWMEGRGRAVYGADGATMLYGVGVDITEQKRAEQQLRFLADVGTILSDVRDLDATLDRLAHLAVSFLADWCLIDLIGDDRRIRRVAAAHVDPKRQSVLDELAHRYPPTWDFPSPVVRVMRTRRPERRTRLTPTILRAMTRDRAHRRMVELLGASSAMVVPLLARGVVLGTISLVRGASSPRYATTDLDLAQDLARRIAVALDSARLFQEIEASNRR
ncbi:MAG TPA: GAF domain-containing protein, partial [Gemmatimonadaceae bacterium]